MASHYSTADEEEEGYFASMTDVVIGLLFVFIIMLMFFAMRFQEATQKQNVVTEQQNKLISDLTDAEIARDNILQGIGTYLQREGINVIIVKDEGILRFPEDILFDKSSWEIKKAGASNALKSLARALDLVLPCYTSGPLSRESDCPKTKARVEAIFIEGNADADLFHPSVPAIQQRSLSVPAQQGDSRPGILRLLTPSAPQNEQARPANPVIPRQSLPPKDNLDLSALRATSTFRELVSAQPNLSQYLSPEKMPVLGVSGYGEYRPLVKEPSETMEQWKQRNRRIDIRILMASPRSQDAKQMQHDIEQNAVRP